MICAALIRNIGNLTAYRLKDLKHLPVHTEQLVMRIEVTPRPLQSRKPMQIFHKESGYAHVLTFDFVVPVKSRESGIIPRKGELPFLTRALSSGDRRS